MVLKHHSDGHKSLVQQRLDSWLWVSRFYKTRKLAASAITAGHIHVNNSKSKPGKSIKPGDQLSINKSRQHYCIIISGLSPTRQSAPEAQSLYTEPDWSREQREQKNILFRNNQLGLRYEHGKPAKRDRQKMVKVKRQEQDLS
jgi:ribosome-associated heat shock protein Hsp15